MLNKRELIKAMGALPAAWCGSHPLLARAQARPYPTKPINLVLGMGPGNAADTVARLVAHQLGGLLNQQIVVENRPGAGGVGAVKQVAGATPDGHALLLIGAGAAISQALFKPPPYDILKAFTPVSSISSQDVLVIVHKDSKLQKLEDFISAAKQRKAGLMVGVSLLGTIQHMGAELLKSHAKVDYTIVPFRTASALASALNAGDIDVVFEFIPPMLSLISGGQLRALAIGNSRRSDTLPDVPTVAEQGYPKFEVASWTVIVAPAQTPEAIVQRLNQDIQRALASPEVVKRFREVGIRTLGGTPAQASQLIASEIARWADVISTSNITLK